MRDLFERAGVQASVVHPYPDQLAEIQNWIDGGADVIIPCRRRQAVRESWIKHGKDPENFAGYSLAMWFEVQRKLGARAERSYYLDIDEPDIRDHQLKLINKELGLDLTTSWLPVRQAAA